MTVNRTTLLLVGFVLALSISACAPLQDVPFDDLVSNPERYHGRRVCTEGIHATGFEVNPLGASLRREGEAVYLTEPAIWLEGAEIRSSANCVDSGAIPPRSTHPTDLAPNQRTTSRKASAPLSLFSTALHAHGTMMASQVLAR
jgi:hypothetical protein